MLLGEACPEDLCVLPEPAVQLSANTEFDMGGAKFTNPPLLVIEIRSPSTALIDLNRKKTAYQEFAVPRAGCPGRASRRAARPRARRGVKNSNSSWPAASRAAASLARMNVP
jgi:Putative restriction endonuclease